MCRAFFPSFAVLLGLVVFVSVMGMPRHRRHQQNENDWTRPLQQSTPEVDEMDSSNCSYTDPYCYNSEVFVDAIPILANVTTESK
uniref:Uncharacterized protein n=1 Tax=Globodera rostochiensis TaxID=31243 RepID=A0A914I9P5_GLORO